MNFEPEVEQAVIDAPDGRIVSYSRYLNPEKTEWVRHGPFRETLRDGTLLSEGQYEHGAEVGPWRDFYPSGVLAAEGEYVAGLEHGLWRFWDEQGKPERTIVYVQGVELRDK